MRLSTQNRPCLTSLFRSGRRATIYLATVIMMLAIGGTAAYASDQAVTLSFSGTSETSPTNLQQPNSSNDGDSFAGKSTLGSFTARNLRAISSVLGSSNSCSGANLLYYPELSGASVIRFDDGSMITMNLTQGGDCIDLTTGLAHCSVTFQITGGSGRFVNATGTLTMTETVGVVGLDALGNPVFFAAAGKFTGTISTADKVRDDPNKEQK